MSRELREAGLLKSVEIAASLGGAEDRGIGITERGKNIILQAVERAGHDLLIPASLEEAVAKRIALYDSCYGR